MPTLIERKHEVAQHWLQIRRELWVFVLERDESTASCFLHTLVIESQPQELCGKVNLQPWNGPKPSFSSLSKAVRRTCSCVIDWTNGYETKF